MNSIKGIIFIHLLCFILVIPEAITYAAIPTTSNSQVTFDEDQIKTLVETDFPFNDVDAHTLSDVKINSLPAIGVLKLNGTDVTANQVIQLSDIIDGNLKYYPEENEFGDPYTTFQFSVIDSNAEESSTATFTLIVNPVNDPPTINPVPDPTAILEDAGLQTINLSGISAGPGETESLTVTAQSSNTSLIPTPVVNYNSGTGTATVTYTPVSNQSGSSTITITVDDGSLNVQETWVVSVTPVNDPPTISAIPNQVTTENQAIVVPIAGISPGPSETSQTLTITANSSNTAIVPHGVVSYVQGSATGSITFTPAPGASGSVTITVQVTDNGGNTPPNDNTTSVSFQLEVQPVNDPPTLNDIANPAAINEDAPSQNLVLTGIGDGDPDLIQTLTITAVSSNTLLVETFNIAYTQGASTGTISYTPKPNANGSATVSVTVSDGDKQVVKSFTVIVNPVNDPPVFSLKGDVSTTENAGPVTVLAQATGMDDGDPELSQSLSFELIVSGTVTFSIPPAINEVTGNLTFETATNSNGTADVTVRLRDNGVPSAISEKTFRITVLALNGKPSFALNGDPPPINEDSGPQTIAGFATAINDGDPDLNQILTFSLVKVSGTLAFKSNPAINSTNGTLTYEPALNSSGTATIAVTLNDSGGESSAPQYFTITVNPINDAPVGTDQMVTTNEDVNYTFKTTDFNSYNDVEGNPFSGIQITSLESDGDLEYNGINVALNQDCPNVTQLVFKPGLNFFGTTEFSFRLRDSQGALSPTYKMTINVTSVEDSPTSSAGEVNTNENTTYTFSKNDFVFTDPDPGDDLTAIRIFSVETRGNLEYNGKDVVVGTEVTNFALLKFIPVLAENGSPYATFRFQVKDKVGNLSPDYIMSINVGSINDRPTGEDAAISTLEDVAYTFKISDFKFQDIDGHLFDGIRIETLETAGDLKYNGVEVVSLPALCPDVTKLVFIPGTDENGANYASFTFKVKDNSSILNLSSANYTMTINVTAVNDAPIFTLTGNPPVVNEDADFQTITGFVSSINDGDAEVVQTVQFSTPAKISGTGNLSFQVQPKIDINGSLTYQPAANTFGTSVFNVYLTDNGGTTNGGVNQSITLSFTISVNPINDAPTINPVANRPPIAEDASTITVNLSNITAGLLEDQTLVVTALSSNLALIPHPSVSYTSPNSTGSISYKPVADINGSATITVTVSDGELSNGSTSISFTVTVTPVNDIPTIDDIPNPSIIQENAGEQFVTITGISAGGGEVQDLLVSAVSSNTTLIPNPISVSYIGGPMAQIRYTPVANQNGESTITVTVNDQSGGIVQKSFNAVISPTNDPPTLNPIPNLAPINEDAGIQQIALTGITAGINENQTLMLSGSSSNSSLIQITTASFVYTSPSLTGTLRFQPIANKYGTTIITVSVSDGIALVSQQFTVEVKPLADTPRVTNASTNQGEQSTTGLVISRNLEDGNEVTYFKITNILNGTLYLQDGITQIVNGVFLPFSQANAGLRFTPSSTVNGSFEIQSSLTNVDSGLGGVPATATIFINSKPTTTDIPDQTVNEDSPQLVFDLYQAFSDKEDPDTSLKFTVTNSSPDLIRTIITGQNLYVDLLPDKSGTAILTIICTDTKGAFVEDKITITITPINDKPTFSSSPITSVNQDQTYSYLVTTIDLEDDQRSFIAVGPPWLSISDNGDGTATLTGVPDQSQVGEHQVEITVKENLSGLFEKQIYKLIVLNVNDAPEIVSKPPLEVYATERYDYDIVVEDADVGQKYTVEIDPASHPSWLILSETSPYSLEGNPPADSEGIYTIKLRVTDDGGLSDEQIYDLKVLPQNKRPTLGNIDQIVLNENQQFQFTAEMFTEIFYDEDPGDTLQFITITVLPINGELLLSGSPVNLNDSISVANLGNLVYKPKDYYSGPDYFFWNASDGKAMSLNTSNVNVTINPVEDPPVIILVETTPAVFYYGDSALAITESAKVFEYDNGLIAYAAVAIINNYNAMEDSIYISAYDGISSQWIDSTGVLNITGIKSDILYQDILRSLRYVNNKKFAPDNKIRTISMIVSDGSLNSVPVEREIRFEDTFISLDIPTGFTPNADGANDTWEIGNIGKHEDAIVRIFTRDGIQVYESIGYYTPWDGVYNGYILRPGVYYFTIEVRKFERRFSGTITLLR